MQLRTILLPVEDMDAAVRFYSEALSLPVRFRDGDRYTALDLGNVSLALVCPDDCETGEISLAVKTQDMNHSLDRLQEAGASVQAEPRGGPHEVRARVHDPSGWDVILYQPLSP